MLLIRFALTEQQLKTLPSSFFNVPTFQVRQIPFSMKLQVLTDELLTKTRAKQKYSNFPL